MVVWNTRAGLHAPLTAHVLGCLTCLVTRDTFGPRRLAVFLSCALGAYHSTEVCTRPKGVKLNLVPRTSNKYLQQRYQGASIRVPAFVSRSTRIGHSATRVPGVSRATRAAGVGAAGDEKTNAVYAWTYMPSTKVSLDVKNVF